MRTCTLIAVFCCIVASSTYGTDCNANGIEDSLELSSCPQIDIVFIFDTSGSANELDDLCDQVDDSIAALESQGYNINAEKLTIGLGGPEVCTCCTDYVANVYGTTTDCYPEILSDCIGDDRFEDWAPATAIVAGEKAWGPGPRVIVPISDEGARCGNPMDAADDTAVDNAIPILLENNVTVFPILGPGSGGIISSEMIGYGRKLAECGTPSGQYIPFDPANPLALGTRLVRLIPTVCPSDYNGNGIIDFCDIRDETSCDLNRDSIPDELFACCQSTT